MLGYFGAEMVPAVRYRRAAGSFTAGEWVPGAEAATAIRMIEPQPVAMDELTPAEQGEDVRDFIKSWTAADVRTRAGGADPDVIEWQGRHFLVVAVDRRGLGNYRKMIMRRTDDR